MRCSNLFLAASALLSTASCAAVKRDDTTFKLYAYGEGIGGAQMFYYNGAAHMGVMENLPSNASAYNVTFSDSNNVWTVSPDNSTSGAPFTNATFYVPSPSNSSTGVGFLTNTTAEPTEIVTSGWMFYGNLVMLEKNGTWETRFSAKTTNYSQVWSLHWNVTDDTAGAIPLAVKKTAPSN